MSAAHMVAREPSGENESVLHLIELGYVDPVDTALREASLRRQLEAEFQQAITAAKEGRATEAITTLERLKVDDPDWIAPHQLLAEIYYRAARWHEAKTELEWLEHHAVESPRIAILSADLAAARREFAAARELLEYAAHVEPDLPAVHSKLGACLLRLGDYKQAATSFEQALVQNAADVRALDGMAVISLLEGDHEGAANWSLNALESDMRCSRAHYHLGIALSLLDRPAEAIAAFETSTRTDPNRLAPYFWLARVASQQLGDQEQANRYRNRGRELIRARRQQRASNKTGG